MELLAPAGHYEAVIAAVQCGADAVYMGFGDFNARRGAKNFSPEDFRRAVDYCHLRGVRVYLTMNTLLSDRELPPALENLRLASRWGVDAVIVQDLGLLRLCRTALPDLPLHGSTQMTIHSAGGVSEAARLGIRCAVLGRELSREDMASICQDSPIAIEVFGHGALCMCWSGQCAMSALIGQRSGNRGLCAQPCRLPYRMDGGAPGHPLSLKDAALCDHLTELTELGAASLKIEGRMKRPEYVAVVTGLYARLLRERRQPTPQERRQLSAAFSRGGFTEGYYLGNIGPDMFGTREAQPESDALFAAARAAYQRENLRLVPVSLTCAVREGQAASLTAEDADGHTVTVTGPVPESARSRSLTAEEVSARLRKTGGTAFTCEGVTASVEEGLSLSASALNGLRREALEALSAARTAPPPRRECPPPQPPEDTHSVSEMAFTVSLFQGLQLTTDLLDLSPAVVYLPVERIADFDLLPSDRQRYPHTEFCAALPRICKDSEARDLLRLLEQAKEKGCTSLSVQNIGQVRLGERLGLAPRGDYGLNLFNSHALSQCGDWGLRSACLSFELRREQLRDLRKPLPCEAIVYGRLPLMITEHCLIANAGQGCGGPRRGDAVPCGAFHTLTDRRGEDLPVAPVFGCRSEIENAKTLYLADKPDFRALGLAYGRLRFTTESPAQCAAILRQYLGLSAAEPPADFTRGLFYRGVD